MTNKFMKSTKQNGIDIERGITVQFNVKIITIQLNNAGVSIDHVSGLPLVTWSLMALVGL